MHIPCRFNALSVHIPYTFHADSIHIRCRFVTHLMHILYTIQTCLSNKFQLCAQLRVCSLTGGSPVYLRPNQPDISESWDGASNDT